MTFYVFEYMLRPILLRYFENNYHTLQKPQHVHFPTWFHQKNVIKPLGKTPILWPSQIWSQRRPGSGKIGTRMPMHIHPGKLTWNLISPNWKGKSSEPNLHFRGSMLIFQGVMHGQSLWTSSSNISHRSISFSMTFWCFSISPNLQGPVIARKVTSEYCETLIQ